MFTGIITDIGTVLSITRSDSGKSDLGKSGADDGSSWGDTHMKIACSYDVETLDIGASIAHSGACMTVVDKGQKDGQNWYGFDVSDESLAKTTMAGWSVGDRINLERALTGKDELGGHIVSGHVDGVARLLSIEEIAGSHRLRFEVPDALAFAIAPKGSITLDGVSLTINAVQDAQFDVNIIPHTWSVTTLGQLRINDKVNLEIDMIARYVARYLDHMTQRQ